MTNMGKAVILQLIPATYLYPWVISQMSPQKARPIFDEDVKVIHSQKLIYPPLARRARVQGVVVIRADLDKGGSVVSSVAVSGNKILIPDCLSNSLKWRFRPNTDQRVIILYDFRITRQGCESPCRSTFTFRAPNIAVVTLGSRFVNPSSQ